MQTRRPTIGDIYKLCLEYQRLASPTAPPQILAAIEMSAEYKIRNQARYEDMRREGHDLSNAWAHKQGYPDFDSYLAAGGSYAKAIKSMIEDAASAASKR